MVVYLGKLSAKKQSIVFKIYDKKKYIYIYTHTFLTSIEIFYSFVFHSRNPVNKQNLYKYSQEKILSFIAQ